MAEPAPIAGPLQARVLEYLWRFPGSTVALVHEALNAEPGARKLAYTTILTVLRNSVRRNLVLVDGSQKTHRFTTAMSRQQYRAMVARWVIDIHFAGDQSAAINAFGAAVARAG